VAHHQEQIHAEQRDGRRRDLSRQPSVTFEGKIFWLHFEPVNGEEMLVTSYPDGSNESYWCSPQQTGQGGA
jgi:hypothetical protein